MEKYKMCKKCKRTVMGKRWFGMCPICFSNLIDIITIVIMVLLMPLVAAIGVLYIISPISEVLLNVAGWVLDLAIGIVALGIMAICLIIILFRAYKYKDRNKKI